MDAVDAVCVDLTKPLPKLISTHEQAIPSNIREDISGITVGMLHDVDRLALLDVSLGELFAEAALAVIGKAGLHASAIEAVGSHGQTVVHRPSGDRPYTVQLGDPNIIAERTGITTVADFRRRDMAAGGQGAPLVPAFHQALFSAAHCDRVVVNIGGMANITVLSRGRDAPVIGFDTGPGNVLLDAWATQHLGAPLDVDGRWAASGGIHWGFFQELRKDAFFSLPPPKSTGRDRFNLSWIQERLARLESLPCPEDVQRTLCELTVKTISEAIKRYSNPPREVLVCGGGAHNPLLMGGLARELSDTEVYSTARFGLEPDWVEAAAFAWLAKRSLQGLAGNLPSVTGARHPVVLGGIYRGGSLPIEHCQTG